MKLFSVEQGYLCEAVPQSLWTKLIKSAVTLYLKKTSDSISLSSMSTQGLANIKKKKKSLQSIQVQI